MSCISRPASLRLASRRANQCDLIAHAPDCVRRAAQLSCDNRAPGELRSPGPVAFAGARLCSFGCDLGELPWRSVKMHVQQISLPSVLPSAVVNFTHSGPFTRVTEWKKMPGHGDNPHSTTVTYEEPCDYRDNHMERYYPVKTSHAVDPNRELYKKYRERAKADGVHFIGRCGRYVYTDMGPCVASTLATVRRFLAGETTPEE